MATLGWLKIGLTTDTSAFSKGLKRASSQVSEFKGMLAGAAAGVGLAFGAKEMIGFVKGTMDASDALHDEARRLGMTQEDLATLGHVAKVAGVDQETLAGSLEKMNARLGEVAVEGKGPAADALRRFGISARELATMNPADAFRQIMGVLGEIPNPAERAKVAMDLFGKSGQAMIQIAGEGKEGIAALEAEAVKLGLAIGAVDSEKIGAANDAMDRLWASVHGLGNTLAVQLAPFITFAADSFTNWMKDGGRGADFLDQALGFVVDTIGEIGNVIQMIETGWHYFMAAFAQGISFLLSGIDGAIKGFGGLFQAITGIKLEVTEMAGDFARAFGQVATDELDKAEKAWMKPWAHERVREFAERIKFEATERAKLAAGKETAFGKGGAVKGAEVGELKFAGAAEMGSKDAYSAILKSRALILGSKGKEGMEMRITADATSRTATATARMVKLLEGRGGGELGREMAGGA